MACKKTLGWGLPAKGTLLGVSEGTKAAPELVIAPSAALVARPTVDHPNGQAKAGEKYLIVRDASGFRNSIEERTASMAEPDG